MDQTQSNTLKLSLPVQAGELTDILLERVSSDIVRIWLRYEYDEVVEKKVNGVEKKVLQRTACDTKSQGHSGTVKRRSDVRDFATLLAQECNRQSHTQSCRGATVTEKPVTDLLMRNMGKIEALLAGKPV